MARPDAVRNGVIAGAMITAVGAIVAALIQVSASDGSDDAAGSGGGGDVASSSPSTDAPSSSPSEEPSGPWLYDWVNATGDNVTVCGGMFPAGETVEFTWVGYDTDGEALDGGVPFRQVPSAKVDDEGRFISVSDGPPPPGSLPDGTVSLRVHAKSGGSDATATSRRSLPYNATTGHIELSETREAVCPTWWN
ncbi:hypothetical protein ACTWP5_03155 [Streptomyces sp. 4N509B]|uniref:hypothetical protein n=1 Tax=Streptomyces sp. 4N509B TaxID=3457413 RepID=UPI003FD5D03B